VIHHSDSHHVSAAEIHRWHLQRVPQWNGIGYHYVIGPEGTIETGRPHEVRGSHAGAAINGVSIGICLTGRFTQHRPTTAQMASLIWLIKHLQDIYGELEITPHRDHTATICPGPLFPWAELMKNLEEVKEVRFNTIAELPDWARPTIQKLINQGALQDTGTGFNLSEDMIRIFVINDRLGLYG